MKKWMETRQVLDRLAGLHSEGRSAALATVVRVRGSAYRHEGARMIVAQDGSAVGNVSGGCLEADVREVALRVIETGEPELREYCGGADEVAAWDLGVGCEGMVEVSVERLAESVAGVYGAIRARLNGNQPFAWCVDLGSGAALVVGESETAGTTGNAERDAGIIEHARRMISSGESAIVRVGQGDVFVDVLIPPPILLVIGRGDDARILAKLAREVGFTVNEADLADVADEADEADRSAASFSVVMSHNYARDRDALRALLATPVRYIGMLGPRQRTERIVAELSATGPVDESRIYGPVGLDIGTDGAEQVAMAVIAEMLAVRSGRRARSLRDRRAPIHAPVGD